MTKAKERAEARKQAVLDEEQNRWALDADEAIEGELLADLARAYVDRMPRGSQTVLAHEVGVSRTWVTNLLAKRQQRLTFAQIRRILAAIDVPLHVYLDLVRVPAADAAGHQAGERASMAKYMPGLGSGKRVAVDIPGLEKLYDVGKHGVLMTPLERELWKWVDVLNKPDVQRLIWQARGMYRATVERGGTCARCGARSEGIAGLGQREDGKRQLGSLCKDCEDPGGNLG